MFSTIKTFGELFQLAFDGKLENATVRFTLFRRIPEVIIPGRWDSIYITEENFKPMTYTEEYRRFESTVEQAMHHLTVEQFKEYWGMKS